MKRRGFVCKFSEGDNCPKSKQKLILTKQPVGSQHRLGLGNILAHMLLGSEASRVSWGL